MLTDQQAIATIAVKDLAGARKFYEEVLGLKVKDTQGSEAITFQTGASSLIVYRSQFAGTNRATAVNWSVGSAIDRIVQGLQERGVKFERYEMPGVTHQGAIHAFGAFKSAWFTDPDGNIHSLMSG